MAEAQLDFFAENHTDTLFLGKEFNAEILNRSNPDFLVYATGSMQNIPEINGLGSQNVLTSIEFFENRSKVIGPRILVIGDAGEVGDIYSAIHQGYDLAGKY